MTQRNDDELRQTDELGAELRDETSADLSAASDLEPGTLTDEEASEAAEIRADIEVTREEMGGTLNELGYRLEPGHLVQEATQNVRDATIGRVEETAKGINDMVMETIKRNPVPAAMAGAGLALLWMNRSNGNRNGHNGHGSRGYLASDYRRWEYDEFGRYTGQYSGQGQGQGIGQKVGDVAGTVGDAAGSAAGAVSGAVGSVAEGAGQAVGSVTEGAGQAVGEVGWRLERFMQASPLAMGAIAIGAGAVAGSLIPETPQERQMLGDASRQVASTVRQTVDEVATKAEEQLDKTEQKVTTGSS